MNIQNLSQVGGVFAVLVFWHFLADWTFQTHKEALAKAKNFWVRTRHCAVYAVMFWFLFLAVGFHGPRAGIATMILFMSHFVIDTYVPVMLWAKYLRRAPQFSETVFIPGTWQDKRIETRLRTDEEAFKAFASTPLGLVLMITMDQLFHIAFLLPVAWLMIL